MVLPQQLPPKLLFVLVLPLFIRNLYALVYWFLLATTSTLLNLNLIISSFVKNAHNTLCYISWKFEIDIVPFIEAFDDYSEITVALGVILLLFMFLLVISILFKACERFTSYALVSFTTVFRGGFFLKSVYGLQSYTGFKWANRIVRRGRSVRGTSQR